MQVCLQCADILSLHVLWRLEQAAAFEIFQLRLFKNEHVFFKLNLDRPIISLV